MLPTRRKLAWVRSGRPVRRAELTSTNSFWDSIAIGDASAWLLFFLSAVCGRAGEERGNVKREEEEGESREEQKKSCRALISLLKDSPPRRNPALAWRTASAKVCVFCLDATTYQ